MIDDFVLGYFLIGLVVGLVFAVISVVLACFEGECDWEGAMVAFAFGFFLWWATIPFVAFWLWKERS